MAKDHIVTAQKFQKTEVLIAAGYGPDSYPESGVPQHPCTAYIRRQYPGEWLVTIPDIAPLAPMATVKFKGKPGWSCTCEKWKVLRSCKHVEACLVMFGGRPFARPMYNREQISFWEVPTSPKRRESRGR